MRRILDCPHLRCRVFARLLKIKKKKERKKKKEKRKKKIEKWNKKMMGRNEKDIIMIHNNT